MLLVLAGRIHTLTGPAHAPGALLVRRGRILEVGAPDTVRSHVGGAAVLDLGDATLTPALTDAHLHLLEWALARTEVDLAGTRSPDEAARLVASAATTAQEWVRGGGWNPHAWGGSPTRHALDAHLPGRPVALRSHDMHALWVSSESLRRAGVTSGTADPPGGRIERDADGAPTGLLFENATRLVLDRIPAPAESEMQAAVLEAQRELHSFGIAAVHSMEMPGATFHSLRVLESLRAADLLRVRVLQHLPHTVLDAAVALGVRSGMGDPWLRVGALKLFMDGALGSRTAWLRAPYEGSDDTGIRLLDADELAAYAQRAAAAGLALAVHAIGDAAVDTAVEVLAAGGPARTGLPHRIEHVQLCPPDRFADFARAGIVCSMQPAHLTTDWRPADRHWGARARHAYAFGSLLAHGATLAFGSDGPVEAVDPRLGFLAATARQDAAGEPAGGWHAAEALSMDQTLRAYTHGPAAAAGMTGRQGVLAAGADADFAAWHQDPLALAGRALLELRCVATMVGGEVVWSAKE